MGVGTPAGGLGAARALLLVSACALAGCGVSDDRDRAREAVESLYAAAARDDGRAACARLSPDARRALEARDGGSCEQAVIELRLEGSRAESVEVYVDQAQVRLERGDTVFAAETAEGWRVSAAGCRGGGIRKPADCEVQA